jgi:hypothetical protein
MIFARHRIIEEDHHSVPGKRFQGAVELKNRLARYPVVAAQQFHHILGLSMICEGGKATQVEENGCDLTPVAFKRVGDFPREDGLGYLWGNKTLEATHAFYQPYLATDFLHQGRGTIF